MLSNEAGIWAGAAALIAALILFPTYMSFHHRSRFGAALFLPGWAGIFGGVALGDRPFMQSEAVAGTWTGISALAIVLAATLLVPVIVEWRRSLATKAPAERSVGAMIARRNCCKPPIAVSELGT